MKSDSSIGLPLLELINNAKSSIDFAIYGIRGQDEILEALINAEKRGVLIRGLVDKDLDNKNYYSSTTKLINQFQNIKSDYITDLETARNKSTYFHKPFWDHSRVL